MRERLPQMLMTAVACAALWFGYRWLFPNDEAQIRALLDRIAAAVGSGAAGEGEVGKIARAASVRRELDPEITVDAGPGFSSIKGRDTLIGTIARFNSTAQNLEVRFVDVGVVVSPDRTTARASMTAEARFTGQDGRGLEARELDVGFRRLDGDWVVSSVALVRTLTPITP
jgi:hypothetical protein